VVVFLLLGSSGQGCYWTSGLDLSPFTHVSQLPRGDVTVAPMIWLVGVAGALAVTGLAAFRQRDIG
jgi:ABC-2 type transport system permease protein